MALKDIVSRAINEFCPLCDDDGADEEKVRVRTHCTYPSMTSVSVAVRRQGKLFSVSDFSSGMNELVEAGFRPEDPDRQFKEICDTYQVKSTEGEIRVTGIPLNRLATAVLRVANASLAVVTAGLAAHQRWPHVQANEDNGRQVLLKTQFDSFDSLLINPELLREVARERFNVELSPLPLIRINDVQYEILVSLYTKTNAIALTLSDPSSKYAPLVATVNPSGIPLDEDEVCISPDPQSALAAFVMIGAGTLVGAARRITWQHRRLEVLKVGVDILGYVELYRRCLEDIGIDGSSPPH